MKMGRLKPGQSPKLGPVKGKGKGQSRKNNQCGGVAQNDSGKRYSIEIRQDLKRKKKGEEADLRRTGKKRHGTAESRKEKKSYLQLRRPSVQMNRKL